ncbi:PXA domain-containing protein [Entophlyctis helioformis]|nr:PXA domain-containing protein [Entophlyctis helioformis]
MSSPSTEPSASSDGVQDSRSGAHAAAVPPAVLLATGSSLANPAASAGLVHRSAASSNPPSAASAASAASDSDANAHVSPSHGSDANHDDAVGDKSHAPNPLRAAFRSILPSQQSVAALVDTRLRFAPDPLKELLKTTAPDVLAAVLIAVVGLVYLSPRLAALVAIVAAAFGLGRAWASLQRPSVSGYDRLTALLASRSPSDPAVDSDPIVAAFTAEMAARAAAIAAGDLPADIADVPPGILAQLDRIISYIVRDFIDGWYTRVNHSRSTEFPDSVTVSLREAFTTLGFMGSRLNPATLVLSLIKTILTHVREYRFLEASGQSLADYRASNPRSVFNRIVTDADVHEHLRDLAMRISIHILPRADRSSSVVFSIVREIVATSVLLPIVNKFADPDRINEMLLGALQKKAKDANDAKGAVAGKKDAAPPLPPRSVDPAGSGTTSTSPNSAVYPERRSSKAKISQAGVHRSPSTVSVSGAAGPDALFADTTTAETDKKRDVDVQVTAADDGLAYLQLYIMADTFRQLAHMGGHALDAPSDGGPSGTTESLTDTEALRADACQVLDSVFGGGLDSASDAGSTSEADGRDGLGVDFGDAAATRAFVAELRRDIRDRPGPDVLLPLQHRVEAFLHGRSFNAFKDSTFYAEVAATVAADLDTTPPPPLPPVTRARKLQIVIEEHLRRIHSISIDMESADPDTFPALLETKVGLQTEVVALRDMLADETDADANPAAPARPVFVDLAACTLSVDAVDPAAKPAEPAVFRLSVSGSLGQWTVSKTYTDFERLHRALLAHFAKMDRLPMPARPAEDGNGSGASGVGGFGSAMPSLVKASSSSSLRTGLLQLGSSSSSAALATDRDADRAEAERRAAARAKLATALEVWIHRVAADPLLALSDHVLAFVARPVADDAQTAAASRGRRHTTAQRFGLVGATGMAAGLAHMPSDADTAAVGGLRPSASNGELQQMMFRAFKSAGTAIKKATVATGEGVVAAAVSVATVSTSGAVGAYQSITDVVTSTSTVTSVVGSVDRSGGSGGGGAHQMYALSSSSSSSSSSFSDRYDTDGDRDGDRDDSDMPTPTAGPGITKRRSSTHLRSHELLPTEQSRLSKHDLALILEHTFTTIEELFQLTSPTQWIRAQGLHMVRVVLHQTYGNTMSAWLQGKVETAMSEPAVERYLASVAGAVWPDSHFGGTQALAMRQWQAALGTRLWDTVARGQAAGGDLVFTVDFSDLPRMPPQIPARTDAQKADTRSRAKALLVGGGEPGSGLRGSLETVARVVGRLNAILGMTRLFNMLQVVELNRLLLCLLIECIVKSVLGQ